MRNATQSESYLETAVDAACEYTKREPLVAVGVAFGAGLLLRLLPIGRIAGMVISGALDCSRPALLGLGLYKATQMLGEKLAPVADEIGAAIPKTTKQK